MKTNSLLYRLFQEQPGLVFELAGWPLPEGAVYTLRAESGGPGGADGPDAGVTAAVEDDDA